MAYGQLGEVFTMSTGALMTMMVNNVDLCYVEGKTAGGRKVGMVLVIGDEQTDRVEAMYRILQGQMMVHKKETDGGEA